jgi:hypothetical protein
MLREWSSSLVLEKAALLLSPRSQQLADACAGEATAAPAGACCALRRTAGDGKLCGHFSGDELTIPINREWELRSEGGSELMGGYARCADSAFPKSTLVFRADGLEVSLRH